MRAVYKEFHEGGRGSGEAGDSHFESMDFYNEKRTVAKVNAWVGELLGKASLWLWQSWGCESVGWGGVCG